MDKMSKQTAQRLIEKATSSKDSFCYCVNGAFKVVARIEGGDLLTNLWGFTMDEVVEDSGQGYQQALLNLASVLKYEAAVAKHTKETAPVIAKFRDAARVITDGLQLWAIGVAVRKCKRVAEVLS